VKIQVLVVDDDLQMREGMSMALTRAGYLVYEASSGADALNILSKNKDIIIMISDVRMPGMTGLELLEKAKQTHPSLVVIMVTAYGTIENAVSAMKFGASDYILKPFSFKDLEQVVGKAAVSLQYYPDLEEVSNYRLITKNKDMLNVMELAKQAAKSSATVLIQAESGTGKELLARYIHNESDRKNKPFIAVNCAALPENLLESELFGYEKGAFTGASAQKPGKFEMADKGTILLDEIGEMAPILQAKLLRVIQEREVDRVGGRKPIPIDVRVIAVTNKDLKLKVREGVFREDLYFRLNVVPLYLPPLRERIDDIDVLVPYFVEKYAKGKKIAPETIKLLKKYNWPGNVRELENVIHRSCVLSDSDVIKPNNLFALELQGGEKTSVAKNEDGVSLTVGTTVEEMEKRLIELTLMELNGNKTKAASVLGISLRTLRNKINQYSELQRFKG
jgi:DNA-binding NtrC family response regulator